MSSKASVGCTRRDGVGMTEQEDVSVRTFECEAILFDLDGVLVDSTAVVVRTWREWAEERGLDAGRILEVAHGRRAAETVRLFAPDLDADSEARELERIEVNDLDGVLKIEGAREPQMAGPWSRRARGHSRPAGWNMSACRCRNVS
jgi:FMN phosphatase YigB (HAD superfamily)